MTPRDAAITKLQQIPESLLQEVNDFIDFVMHKHQVHTSDQEMDDMTKEWTRWFEGVDQLKATPIEPRSDYEQLLLDKYRQQGLSL